MDVVKIAWNIINSEIRWGKPRALDFEWGIGDHCLKSAVEVAKAFE